MQRHHFFKIKTVNLDPDLFIQDVQPSNKLTAPIIRTLTHRKDREREKYKLNSQQAEIMTTRSKNKNSKKQCEQKKEIDGFDFVLSEFDTHFLKRNIKNKHANHIGFPIKRHQTFRRYNHSHTNSIEHKAADKLYEWQPEEKRRGQNNKNVETGTSKVDPYTKNQYIYMKNRKNDEILQLRRSMKMQKVNSIVKSYRIATMNLNPPTSRRSNSVKFSKEQRRKQSDTIITKIATIKKESQIKPWDWSLAEDSKQYL